MSYNRGVHGGTRMGRHRASSSGWRQSQPQRSTRGLQAGRQVAMQPGSQGLIIASAYEAARDGLVAAGEGDHSVGRVGLVHGLDAVRDEVPRYERVVHAVRPGGLCGCSARASGVSGRRHTWAQLRRSKGAHLAVGHDGRAEDERLAAELLDPRGDNVAHLAVVVVAGRGVGVGHSHDDDGLAKVSLLPADSAEHGARGGAVGVLLAVLFIDGPGQGLRAPFQWLVGACTLGCCFHGWCGSERKRLCCCCQRRRGDHRAAWVS